MQNFFAQLEARLAPYDLLKHPYYQAWSAGELTGDDLRSYASEYWHHVAAFPTYLSALHSRLPDGELRRVVLANLVDEEGLPHGRPHADLWMDFATGMGAEEAEVKERPLNPETTKLIEHFKQAMTEEHSAAASLAVLYAYESKVPAIAKTKADGLRKHYDADARTSRYFDLHTKADIHHARVWEKAIAGELAKTPDAADAALTAAEAAAKALWTALDGIEHNRQQQKMAA